MSSACALLLRRWAHNLSEVGLCWGAYKGPREEEHPGLRDDPTKGCGMDFFFDKYEISTKY